jgi:hypothetical protein
MSHATKIDILAPFEIWEVMLDNSTIKFFKPLILNPVRVSPDPDEPDNEEYWIVEVPELMISTFGHEYHSIWSGVLSDIRDAWKHIVSLPDDSLSPNGKKIKQRYLALAEEVLDG